MMKKQVAALLLAINEINNMTPVTSVLVWKETPTRCCDESFVKDFYRTGGRVLNRLLFATAYAETIGDGMFKTVPARTNVDGDVVLSGGWQYVLDGGHALNTTIYKDGTQNVFSGGTANGTVVNGGQQVMSGTANNTRIYENGVQTVLNGGRVVNTIIYKGGNQDIVAGGIVSGTVINGGQQSIGKDGSANETSINSGQQHIKSGGSANVTMVNGGLQEVSGLADRALINNGGTQVVKATGKATNTTVGSGGIQQAEGTAEATVVNSGGAQYVYGHAANTNIGYGGRQVVASGGRAAGTTIGGVVELALGGNLDGATLLPQGELLLQEASDGQYAVESLAASGGTITMASGKTAGRKLTINALSGSSRFVINTDLAQHRADLITVARASATGDNQLQVHYDPLFGGSQVKVSGSALFANTPAGVGFQAQETEYGPCRYKPILTANSFGGRTNWFVDSFVLDGQSQAMQTAGAMTKLALPLWRSENNDLAKRMGELRSGNGCSIGAWLRTYRGSLSLEAEENGNVSTQYNVVQGGYDWKRSLAGGVWYQGYTAGWMEADAVLLQGSGRTNTFMVGGYGTWLGAKGHFWDIVVKYGWSRSHYDTWVSSSYVDGGYRYGETSLSLEYGKRQQLCGGWYLEPQVELNLGWIGPSSYQNSDGAKIYNGATQSVVGRLGATVGKFFGRGTVYMKTSLVREFTAEPSVSMSMVGTDPLTVEQDMREHWLEFSLGATAKINRQLDAYLELDRMTGKLVKEPWMIDAGLRWNF